MKLLHLVLLFLLSKNCFGYCCLNKADSVPLPDSIHLVHIVLYGQYTSKQVVLISNESILIEETLRMHRILNPASFLNTCLKPDHSDFKIQVGRKIFNLNYANGKFIRIRRIGCIYFLRQEPDEFGPWRRNPL